MESVPLNKQPTPGATEARELVSYTVDKSFVLFDCPHLQRIRSQALARGDPRHGILAHLLDFLKQYESDLHFGFRAV